MAMEWMDPTLSRFFVFAVILYVVLIVMGMICLLILCRILFSMKRAKYDTVGFFHPFCNDGGGGERVLWMMIAAIQRDYPGVDCVVYSGDRVRPADIFQRVKDRFGITLDPKTINIQYLHSRSWLEASNYQIFTMLGQSLGSILVVLEALFLVNPHIFIDSMGYAFTLWIARVLGGCSVAAYVHYPTISSDMLSKVTSNTEAHNNRRLISKIPFLRYGKLVYYRLFALVYGLAGRACSLVLVNSTWTKDHINTLWNIPKRTFTLYPPCNTSDLSAFPFSPRNAKVMISIAQFRPEKDHALQIKAFAEVIKEPAFLHHKLVLIGSCRHEQDEKMVQSLKKLVIDLGADDNVTFQLNVPFSILKNWYAKAQFGIHTMWCEHFGIGIVELMASGVVVVAHNSGGPAMDIIKPVEGQESGFLATSVEEYSKQIRRMFSLPPKDIESIQVAARKQSERFSDETFQSDFISRMQPLFKLLTHTKVQ